MRHADHLPAGLGGSGHPGDGGLLGRVAHQGEVDGRGTGRQRGEGARRRPGTRLGRTVGLQIDLIHRAGGKTGHVVERIRDIRDGGTAAERVESAGFAVQQIPALHGLLEVEPAEVGGVGSNVGHRGRKACAAGDNVGDTQIRAVRARGVGRRRVGRIAVRKSGAVTADVRATALGSVLVTTVRVVGGVVGVRSSEGDTHYQVAGAVPHKRGVKVDGEPASRRIPVAGIDQGKVVVGHPVACAGEVVVRAKPHVGAEVRHKRRSGGIVELDGKDDGTGRHVGGRELGRTVDLLVP